MMSWIAINDPLRSPLLPPKGENYARKRTMTWSLGLMHNEQDDDTLADQAAAGDPGAMTALLERHFDYVNSVCRRIVRDPGRTEDARQETLFKAARMITSFDHRSSFRTWLHAIACNVSLNQLRSERRVPVPEPEGERAPSGTVGPASFERAVEARIDIDAALERMTVQYRDVIILRYLCDLDYEGIAEVLDISIGTVRSRLNRGIAQLRKIFLGNLSTVSDV